MSWGASRSLTQRQRAVMERIDRRASIKVIARELGVSETRINQHIRALKNIYEAENLAELVECYRADTGYNDQSDSGERDKKVELEQSVDPGPVALSESVYSKNQVPISGLVAEPLSSDDPGEIVIRDVSSMVDEAPWLRPGEPRVVHRVLDGEHALWVRLVAIVGIAFGFLAAVVLTVTAAVTISEALDGYVTTVPVD